MVVGIVDDDRDLLKALRRLLSAFGHDTELFSSAEEFLGVALVSKAECLVVDVQLGKMSGLDLVRRLSAIGIKLPVICMSGSVQDKFRKEAVGLGCTAYLQKPFDPALLIAAVERATGAKAAVKAN